MDDVHNIYLFILDPVGPMIQLHLQEKYMHSSQLAHRQGILHYHTILRGTSSKRVSMQASQRTLRSVDSTRTSRTVTLRPQDKRHTVNGRQSMCRSHSPPTSPTATLHRKARRNIAPHSTGRRRRVMQCRCKYPA